MCGIFGYVGKQNAAGSIVQGLKRLEYRGYDSWGVAIIDRRAEKIKISKKVGKIGDLAEIKNLPDSHIGIGHTRWATHGGVTKYNAHPHASTQGDFVLAQNGIVENYQELKERLAKAGYKFETETDTEVIVRLVESKQKKYKDLKEAIRQAFLELEGRNTIIALASKNNRVVAIRNGSPLVVGVGKDEYFFASDTLSFADKTDKVIFVEDMQMLEYHDGDFAMFRADTGKSIKFKISKLDHEDVTIDKEGYAHFMLKEIVEQKFTIRDATQYSEKELEALIKAIKKAKTVYTTGAGTASFAAGQIAFYLRKYAKVNAIDIKSYETESYEKLFSNKDLLIAVSQSGETADTIEAVEEARKQGVKIASIVNMLGSTITRISDFKFFSRSGPEICVASTKAFTAQISWGYLLAQAVAGNYKSAQKHLHAFTNGLENYFSKELFASVKKLAKVLLKKEHFFVLGKGQNYYISLEAALKVKEITYKHFEGFAAGELKHGVIALIDKGTPVFIIAPNDANFSDMIVAAAEVKARGAYIVGVGEQKNDLFDYFLPIKSETSLEAIASILPFQLLSYFLALELERNPDKPRNLAKSVTVK